MNDIFKLFKKRAQAGKSTNITDVIKDLNEKEQTEMMSDVGKFDRSSKSYLSISKSGRLKSKKSQNSRALQEDLFTPGSAVSIDITSHIHSNNLNKSSYESAHSRLKPIIYDQNSDNADSRASSTSSSFRSSFDEAPPPNLRMPSRLVQSYYNQPNNNIQNVSNGVINSNYQLNNANNNYSNNRINSSNTNKSNSSNITINNNNNNIFKRFY
jgi:hypothetical protein